MEGRREIAGARRRRALSLSVAAALALGAAGCSSAQSGSSAQSSGNPPVVTAEQVLTTCFQDYFYNGILPESAAKANCMTCVVDELRKLGIRPSPGESEVDVLTGVRLSASHVQTLQNACTEADASSQ